MKIPEIGSKTPVSGRHGGFAGNAANLDFGLGFTAGLFDVIGDEERQLQSLRRVEARVAVGFVTRAETGIGDGGSASGAFGDFLAGHFEVNAAGMDTFGAAGIEEAADFGKDAREFAGFIAAFRNMRVAMHRVAAPDDGAAAGFGGAQERRQAGRYFFVAHAGDERETSGLVGGVQDVDELEQVIGFHIRAAFEAERVFDAAQEFDMRTVGLPRAFAYPQHMGGDVVPVAGRAVDAGQRLFIGQQ